MKSFLRLLQIVVLAYLALQVYQCQNDGSNTLPENSNRTTPKTNKRKAAKKKNWKEPELILDRQQGAVLLCQGEELDLLPYVQHYSDSVTALNLRYNAATRNDCSGTFLRMNEYLNTLCPGDGLPSFAVGRSTQDLIQYYDDKGLLLFVENPLASDHLIQPGVVMFYARGGQGGKLKFNSQNMRSYVNHVGVVYDVTTDPATGKVISYRLFHGRNPKRGINITDYHKREPYGDRLKAYPYGNGDQQWMGVAPLADNR